MVSTVKFSYNQQSRLQITPLRTVAQADSEIAFHSSPVFLNSKQRLGNGGRFDLLNFV